MRALLSAIPVCLPILILSRPAPAAAGEEPVLELRLDAEQRARAELFDDGLFDGDLGGNFRVGNRVRAGIRLDIADTVGIYAQVQDVRFWGSELHPVSGGDGTLFDFSANGFDLHQGYGELRPVDGMVLRIGRQEVSWHGQRLIGAVGWAHQGRSFDGVRVTLDREPAGVELFWALLLDRPNAIQANPRDEDAHLVALRGGPRLGDALTLDGLAILRLDSGIDEQLLTAGAHAKGAVGLFRYEAEAYFQGGNRGGDPVTAWLLGLRGGVALGDKSRGGTLGAGLDIVSGDGDPADAAIHAFDTLYATNHKFYGHLDQYLALPLHTGGFGLIDVLVGGSLRPVKNLSLGLDGHVFLAAAAAPERFHGVEIDVDGKWTPLPGFHLSAGVWVYVPGGFWGTAPRPELGAYVQTGFKLGQP